MQSTVSLAAGAASGAAGRSGEKAAQRALAELDEARKNRDASVGVFVMAKSHAPDGFPSFARYGTNVLVTWDEDDAATDPYLRAAVFLGIALVSRSHSSAEPGDIDALQDIERTRAG